MTTSKARLVSRNNLLFSQEGCLNNHNVLLAQEYFVQVISLTYSELFLISKDLDSSTHGQGAAGPHKASMEPHKMRFYMQLILAERCWQAKMPMIAQDK